MDAKPNQETASSVPLALLSGLRIWMLLLACGGLLFLTFANGYDWDQFYTFHEIDRQSWLLEGRAPFWSYQFCAGSTRAGDAQAFGLSPLFVFVLLFGSFWGTKLMVWCCFLLGVWFMAKLIQTLALPPDTNTDSLDTESISSSYILAFLFVSSNGFLWHLVIGHVAYGLIYLGVGLIYYTLKAWRGRWQRSDWLPALVLTFSYYAAGFYLAQVFFLLPFFVGLGLLLLFELLQNKKPKAWLQRTWQMVGFHLIGLLLASYKLLYILHYQKHFPRVMNSHEPVDLSFLLLSPFLPTIDHQLIGLGKLAGFKARWVFEYSFFHFAGWGLLLTLLVALWQKGKGLREPTKTKSPQRTKNPEAPEASEAPKASGAPEASEAPEASTTSKSSEESIPTEATEAPTRRDNIWLLLGGLGVVVLGFALGDTVPWSLHSLLNHHLLKHSIRVVDRYQIGFVFLLHLAWGVVLLRRVRLRDFFLKWMAAPLFLLMLLNVWTFSSELQSQELRHYLSVSNIKQVRRNMQIMYLDFPQKSLPYYPLLRSNMYHLARSGVGIPYCYNPMNTKKDLERWMVKTFFVRRDHIQKDPNWRKITQQQVLRLRMFPLIATELTPVSKECLQKSSFTQHRIVLHKSCPQDICLNISQPNLYDPQGFSVHQVYKKLCRGTPRQRASLPKARSVPRTNPRPSTQPTSQRSLHERAGSPSKPSQ